MTRREQIARIEAIVRKQELFVGKGWRLYINTLSNVQLKQFEEAISGGVDGIIRVMLPHTEQLAQAVAVNGFISAGNAVAQVMSAEFKRPLGFDPIQQTAVAAMQANKARLVAEVTDKQRQVVSMVISDGLSSGKNRDWMAREIRKHVGLTLYQYEIVNNYRMALENGNANALDRALRDKRYDSTVFRAVYDDEPLTQGQIDRMVDRYRKRFEAYRASVIARTESHRSVMQAQRLVVEQGIFSGKVSPSDIEHVWNTHKDELVRGTHRPMDGQRQPWNAPFVSGSGAQLLYPGDPSAPAAETIQCRCTEFIGRKANA